MMAQGAATPVLAPYTEEEERVAESLVDEAIRGFDQAVPAPELAEIRDAMVDELLCTSYGRAKLRPFLKPPTVLESAELERIAMEKKKESGSA